MALTVSFRGIQARMAALLGNAGVAQGPVPAAVGIYVRRLKIPELIEGVHASKNLRIQREVDALRSMNRVRGGSQTLLKIKTFGGRGAVNQENQESDLGCSLQCISIIEKVKKRRTGKV